MRAWAGRLGDKANVSADAHGCPGCPHPGVGPAILGSADVLVNSRPALRVDDTGIHTACCGPNTWTAQKGAATVFINNKAAFRMNDPSKHCGGMGSLVEGSSDVIVGDSGGGGGGGGGGGSAGSGSAAGAANGASTDGSGASPAGSGGSSASQANPAAGNATPTSDQPNSPIASDEIEVRVVDAGGKPVKGLFYVLTLPDGAKRTGNTDDNGIVKLTDLTQRGDCTIKFPDIDDAPKPGGA